MKAIRFVLLTAVILLVSSPLLTAATQPDLLYYVGTDQHVHELRFGGTNWQTTDLMGATGAPNAASGSALTGHVYGTSDNVFYVATDQHVHELAYYGSPATWHTGDVTAAAGAPNATAGSALTSHVYGNADAIYYIATDGAIHELAFYGSPATWHTLNSTALSGAPNPVSGSPLTSEVYPNDNAEHIYFIAGDQHVHEISFVSPTNQWSTIDVTSFTGAPNAATGSDLTSHVYGNSDNVWYIATDQHVHSFAFYNGTYHTSDITQQAGAPNAIAGSSLASNVNGGTDDAYFINPDPHVNQLWFDGVNTWHSVDVTALAGGPNPASGTGMTSHVYGTAEAIYHFAADQHVHELAFYSNSWHASDPTALAGAPTAMIARHDLIGFLGL